MAMTNLERMIAGERYDFSDPELAQARERAAKVVRELNRLDMEDAERHAALLAELGVRMAPGARILTPFRCVYGFNIALDEDAFVNHDALFLDTAPIRIGARAMLGPRVQIYGSVHPLDAAERAANMEVTRPVTIGADVWIGGAAVLLPGVTIGERAVVGAGAVVTKPVPPDVVVAGNPARIIRHLGDGS